MSKRELVHLLREQTETLRGQFSEICSALSELTQCVSAEEFFPECLAETVLEKLPEAVALQAEVKKQFSALGTGDVPLKLEETAALLEEYESRLLESEKYIVALRFFLSLRSEDREIQNLLEQRQEVLRAYDLKKWTEIPLKRQRSVIFGCQMHFMKKIRSENFRWYTDLQAVLRSRSPVEFSLE